MVPDVGAIRAYFAKLGLASEIADLYLALYSEGPQTISELSRSSGVERTRIYRLIDSLLNSNLVEVESHYKRGVIKAAPITNLQLIISQKEQELRSLQDELGLIEQLLARNSLSSPATRVQFYRGPAGAKQMFWNQTRSKTEILSILYQNMQIKTNSTFFERWVAASNQKGLIFRSLVSDTFLDSQKEWYNAHQNERLKNWEGRYVSKDILYITHSTVIYNDIVAHYNWKDNEVFGIEIHNQDIANTQRQFFETFWSKSQAADQL